MGHDGLSSRCPKRSIQQRTELFWTAMPLKVGPGDQRHRHPLETRILSGPSSTCWIGVCIFTASLDSWAHSVWGAPLKPALCFGFAWIQLPAPRTSQLYRRLVLKSRLPFNHSSRMHCLGGRAYRELNVLHQSVSYFRVEDRRDSITPTLENPSHKKLSELFEVKAYP